MIIIIIIIIIIETFVTRLLQLKNEHKRYICHKSRWGSSQRSSQSPVADREGLTAPHKNPTPALGLRPRFSALQSYPNEESWTRP